MYEPKEGMTPIGHFSLNGRTIFVVFQRPLFSMGGIRAEV